MNFPLDTHVWIWSVGVTAKVSLASQSALANRQHNFFLSPISIWETLRLIEKKRLPINIAPQLWIEHALQFSGVQEAPLTYAVARRCRQLQLPQ